uniref:RING-CH-type domain-containing protein n=1 Tax=Chromera velia CCMP2878 TaxID=1169474 RepID=A0A0G4FQ14_9ALVE|eukprot:Cvel_18101.t1-p1 / transcript=Cvel_18101.t1 / gene=Cvel_18101 / organism=Chromera_velia_CCMP2878 / gene_product=E3 ubiquitin-protein ligase MARCH3, putative / transcript_product=E3 ubiquitin-protein ligase MARCH3, putative / location=Cvel_scaffold1484:854-1768(+) / protein_length=305 / sequence_SO=supercontig / SO=protein_coding / is_pseudo=false
MSTEHLLGNSTDRGLQEGQGHFLPDLESPGTARVAPEGHAGSSPVPRRESEQSDSVRVCRICHDGEEEGELIHPCKCSGSVKFVHRTCLDQWRSCTSINPQNMTRCEMCHHTFAIEIDGTDAQPKTMMILLYGTSILIIVGFCLMIWCMGIVLENYSILGVDYPYALRIIFGGSCLTAGISLCISFFLLAWDVMAASWFPRFRNRTLESGGCVFGWVIFFWISLEHLPVEWFSYALLLMGFLMSIYFLIAYPIQILYNITRGSLVKTYRVKNYNTPDDSNGDAEAYQALSGGPRDPAQDVVVQSV